MTCWRSVTSCDSDSGLFTPRCVPCVVRTYQKSSKVHTGNSYLWRHCTACSTLFLRQTERKWVDYLGQFQCNPSSWSQRIFLGDPADFCKWKQKLFLRAAAQNLRSGSRVKTHSRSIPPDPYQNTGRSRPIHRYGSPQINPYPFF